MAFNFDTVKSTEKREENSLSLKGIGFRKIPDFGGPVKEGRVVNYTCPACKQVLAEAVTKNGKVRGWCGVKGQYVGGG
jgi:hypothetical protein